MNLELCNDPPGTGPIHFYELKHYWLSNFSAFAIRYGNYLFPTSEHCYQARKFPVGSTRFMMVLSSASAHEAMLYARKEKAFQRADWDSVKRDTMKAICRAKLEQHEYIQRKLPLTGDRELIEASPVDAFWGMGPDGKGRNELGKIWMELRTELLGV